MNRFVQLLQRLWDGLFPAACPNCGRYAEAGGWCSRCRPLVCQMRRLPVVAGGFLDECWAVAYYSGAVRKLLWDVKYKGRRDKCRFLAELLDERMFTATFEVVVPIPLHTSRQHQRGYNQAAEIFKPWCDKKGLRWQELLRRQKDTQPQYSLNRQQRWQNMRAAFTPAEAAAISGRSILLADDIYTSGATLQAAAYALKKAGAVYVGAIVIASDADKKNTL